MAATVVPRVASKELLAEARLLHVLAMSLQVAALILLALNTPTAVVQISRFPLWWTCLAGLVFVVPALLQFTLRTRMGTHAVRRMCGGEAIAFLVVLVIAPLALDGQRLPVADGLPWLVQLAMIAGAAAGVAWSVRGVLAYVIGLQIVVFGLVFLTTGQPLSGQAIGSAVFGAFYVTLLATLALALRRASVLLDRTMRSAIVEARASSTAEASRTARRRVASLIHDSIIVALLAHSSGHGTTASAAIEARSALESISDFDRPQVSRDWMPTELAWHLQAITTEYDPDATFDHFSTGSSSVPASVTEAMSEAMSEALRNSIQHAGPGHAVIRQVRVSISDDAVHVVVLDNGEGFNPLAVAPVRFGIKYGIVDRVSGVPGGSAHISSTPGYGTIVSLDWSRE